jgi:hypothetical protein
MSHHCHLPNEPVYALNTHMLPHCNFSPLMMQTRVKLGEKDADVFKALQKCQMPLAKLLKESQKCSGRKEDEEMD